MKSALLRIGTAALLGTGLAVGVAAPAQAAGVGYVRLAHLSPDSPEVDVYLEKVGSTTFGTKIFGGVGYGVVSAYQIVPTGSYLVSMRPKGAPASTPTTLTASVSVVGGKAYTVAGVGRNVDLGLRVLSDDLSRPPTGKAKVRIIQASGAVPLLDVALPDGTPIASTVAFATATAYQQVAPGNWALALRASGSPSVMNTVSCSLEAGDVYSVIVLDGANGRLRAEARIDARGGSSVPVDGVATGSGGTAGGSSSPLALVGLGAVVTLGLAVLWFRLLRLGRRRS
ncbi:MAG: DUF4397 domain-containing protein [Micromonosporaceae bacterium]